MNLAVMSTIELGLVTKWTEEGLPLKAFVEIESLAATSGGETEQKMLLSQIALNLIFCAVGLLLGLLAFIWEKFLMGQKMRHVNTMNSIVS